MLDKRLPSEASLPSLLPRSLFGKLEPGKDMRTRLAVIVFRTP